MTKHKVLILGQGTGRRWDRAGRPFLGQPKHLLRIDGESLVARAVRLFGEAGCEVVLFAPDDERYPSPRQQLANPFPTNTEQDKLLGTREHWNTTGRTIIAWGDCYYTEEAVRTITQHPSEELHYFRRPAASEITGHPWDESFAISWGPQDAELVERIAREVVADRKSGRLRSDHIRSHLAKLLGRPYEPASHVAETDRQTVIDDWTDDFDRPSEWVNWVGKYYSRPLTPGGNYTERLGIAICAPWREGDAYRENARGFTRDHYGHIYYGTADGPSFNRSAARNAAARAAIADGAKVLFFVDTDTLVTREQVVASCYLALKGDMPVFAFEEYHRLTERGTAQKLSGLTPSVSEFQVAHNHQSGAQAIPVSLWQEIGGYDERFSSWGAEDRAFSIAAYAHRGLSEPPRIPGAAVHLWHPPSPERDKSRQDYQDNVALGMRYKRAGGVTGSAGALPAAPDAEFSHEALHAILREPGGPLSDAPPLGYSVEPSYQSFGRAVYYGPSAARPRIRWSI